nr:right-handed parallel beta-helix repeat-containing protein [Klebsiella pneumoniae]
GPVKLIILGSLYKISSSFYIPDGVTIRGGGPETGVYLEKAPAEPMHIIFNMACVGSRLENFGVYFNTGGQGSISAVQIYGVFLQANSKDCTINWLTINGKPDDTVMGFSNGIRCTGTGNKISFCDIQYCSMGITARGDKHQITMNYCNNHFVDENLSAWSSSSPYWDGITAEGLSNSLIADNICEYNGQSGIYIGGNNSLSYDNIISRNTIRYNFNRGIDNGVSGTVSTTNSVLRNIITSNVIYDNREPQLWLFNANDFVVDGNSVRITSNYASIFGS